VAAREDRHKRVVMGVEIEAYTISLPGHRITRRLASPRRGVGERGERFTRDASIGTEYIGRPFATIREGLFLLKAGLRKYSQKYYERRTRSRQQRQLLLVGGWRDRFAGTHMHLSVAGRELSKDDARRLAGHIHDHIPFLIAAAANSPVWADEITDVASNRVLRASRIYFQPTDRGRLTQKEYDELVYSPGRKRKPPTLEFRVPDSNVPEYVVAVAAFVKAIALDWLRGRGMSNRLTRTEYMRSREVAAVDGMKARLCWRGEWIPAPRYLDRFVWAHRDSLEDMDLPEEVWTTLRLLKRGWTGAAILRAAARHAYEEHPQTWQARFARRYVSALDELLSGHTVLEFAQRLEVELPDVEDVWLGGRHLVWP
jgi:gamma-glutamyl:cysteine ligase YbdK (ATP-grasp superfamily)